MTEFLAGIGKIKPLAGESLEDVKAPAEVDPPTGVGADPMIVTSGVASDFNSDPSLGSAPSLNTKRPRRLPGVEMKRPGFCSASYTGVSSLTRV